MKTQIEALLKQVGKMESEESLLRSMVKEKRKRFEETNNQLKDALEARVIIQTVAEQTQKNLEMEISSIVSKCLSIFPDPYEFVCEFVQRRNRTECDLYFTRNGHRVNPSDELCGGGPIDIASFALRLVYIQLKKLPKVLILDQPFSNLSADLKDKSMELMRELSEKLGIQIIMVSHTQEYMDRADKLVMIKNGRVDKQKP